MTADAIGDAINNMGDTTFVNVAIWYGGGYGNFCAPPAPPTNPEGDGVRI